MITSAIDQDNEIVTGKAKNKDNEIVTGKAKNNDRAAESTIFFIFF
jgi:hypothetical protein